MIQINRDTYRLSSGRDVYANRGIIGINPEGEVHEGYDGGIPCEPDYWDEEDRWTPVERAELADYMIGLWTAFKLKG